MLYDKGRWTLICYAGSASEASIGSQPMGGELVVDMVTLCPESQGFPNGPHVPNGHRAVFGARS